MSAQARHSSAPADQKLPRHGTVAAARVRRLGAIFPGSDLLRLRFAGLLETLDTPQPLFELTARLLAIAAWLDLRGELADATEAELLADFVREEAAAWPP